MAIGTKFQRRDDEAQGIEPELGKGTEESKRDKPKELAAKVPRVTQGLPEGADVPRV